MMRAVLALVVLALGVSACGDVTIVSSGASPSSASPNVASPGASPTPWVCTDSHEASGDWPAPSSSAPLPEIGTADVNNGLLLITFVRGTPAFDIATQPNTHFVKDPSGESVDLGGNAGVLIHLRGFVADPANFSGNISITSLGPFVKEVRVIGNFEGVITIAVGLESAGCANVETFNGQILRFYFIKPAA